MSKNLNSKGNFTLPGEAGYEDLTLQLAKKWGADAIRDSDGTVLSDKIISADFNIYSTICLVRIDNQWAKQNMDKLQQNYLMTMPVIAEGSSININLLNGYFKEQFKVNSNDNPKKWWQVFDRTTGQEIPAKQWHFNKSQGIVTINNTIKWHKYTVNFLAYRIWEAISMYNHITNNWGDREHLMPIDPIYLETQEFILTFLDKWLKEHPKTDVVRFTSMFYNFAWFWGDNDNLKYIYSDWGAYDNTVSPLALSEFSKMKGYQLTSEDFVNNGNYCSSHNVPSKRYLDWMDFINNFVATFSRKCINLVHKAGKKAYMFYDDHWVGTEPYSNRYKDMNFDGLIKCVFNGFELRKCAAVEGVAVKELRLHPYLFPTGLKGEPTFKEGGNPKLDCKRFWVNIRRALLRKPIDRIGLGGYLHLVEGFPDFVEYIEELINEFRTISEFHKNCQPYIAPFKVAILTCWGKLRSWICSGHFNHGLDLNEIIESLSGLPIEVEFISFEDILTNGITKDIKVIINAGRVNSSWSGGNNWQNEKIITKITDWIAHGGGFIGVGEPSAFYNNGQYFQLAHLLGVDREIGMSLSKDKYLFEETTEKHFIMEDIETELDFGKTVDNIFILSDETEVLAVKDKSPMITLHNFKRGKNVYFSGYKFTPQNTRLLHRAIFWAAEEEKNFYHWMSSNIFTECAYFSQNKKLLIINNSDHKQTTKITDHQQKSFMIDVTAHGLEIIDI